MARIDFEMGYWRGYDVRVLRELLTYEPSTGEMRWKPRALKWFTREADHRTWNTKNANAVAGCIDKASGYRVLDIFDVKHFAHRVAWALMTGEHLLESEGEFIDHIDQQRANNVWTNLRAVTNQENKKNAPRQVNNTSGITGVYRHKRAGKWLAQITVDGRKKHLGYFTTLEEAAAARAAADIKYGFHENHGAEKKAA